MAYYDALVAKWATLSGTTQQKLTAINALTVTGSVPSTFFVTGAQILNCINWTEFAALTTRQQDMVLAVLTVPGQIKGGASSFVGGLFVATFSLAGATIAALTALAQATVQPWWQATVAQGGGGLSSPVSVDDLNAAGLS